MCSRTCCADPGPDLTEDPPFLRRSPTGVTISLHVQPRSRRTALAVSPEGTLKAAVTAPPEDGRANDAVIALVANSFGVRKSTISLKQGAAARDKVLSVTGEPVALAARIGEWVRGNG